MTQLAKKKVKIALAQISPRLGDIDYNLRLHIDYIERAIKDKADIIMFPELSLTGYSLKDSVYDTALTFSDKFLDPLYQASKDIAIGFGMVELSNLFEAKNSILFLEDGKCIARHRKVYLPTYGVFEEKRYFTPGNRFHAFESRFVRRLVSIHKWSFLSRQVGINPWSWRQVIVLKEKYPRPSPSAMREVQKCL